MELGDRPLNSFKSNPLQGKLVETRMVDLMKSNIPYPARYRVARVGDTTREPQSEVHTLQGRTACRSYPAPNEILQSATG